ncbi:hypothetical protein DICSQDRAFT_169058 [Dichomitus squalens LYAD-421 SS1]|uniref:uncharacterized protein n=1 Tax=Dichomitus squalens (strain LYAD-421) TaxID=732165 RepID=UPI00044157BC|nr:uncharacterized protein DICSQDRAFT_169058 [Dichomitus squalens LYAD-421 SS1]EJF62668.1 hypothetical protein DICSQDRAFT_169058 [Dichomitus squalens LYAD-421 SS1]
MPSRRKPLDTPPSLQLRTCFQCRQPPGTDVQLKRCAGCADVVYCSKECQKAAWPKHKEICRPIVKDRKGSTSDRTELVVRRYGYRNAIEFHQALKDFIEANHWAFQTFAKALALMQGDSASDSDEAFSKMLQVNLLCSKNSRQLNPACSFVMSSYRWIAPDDFRSEARNAEEWARAGSLRELATERYKKNLEFKALRTIVFRVAAVGMCDLYFYAQYRCTLPILDLAPQDIASLPAMVEDVFAITKASINADMAFKCGCDDTSDYMPLPGHFVQKHKSWVWEASFSSWDTLMENGRRCWELDLVIDVLSRLKSGYAIPDILGIVQLL